MSMLGKKKIQNLQVKKTIPLGRLIKCYVCNQHLESQSQFDIHIKQHQSKLSRTNVEEIQRKTQESFNKKKQPLMLNKTQSQIRTEKEKVQIEKPKDTAFIKKESKNQDQEQNEIQEALKQSQILLEKLEFLTQPIEAQAASPELKGPAEEVEYIQKCIQGERKLYQLITTAQNSANIEKLILQTDFETRYFQNYQQQLMHLRILASAAVLPDSVAKIMDIRKKICRDICDQLKEHYQIKQQKHKLKVNMKIDAQMTQNTGEVRYCAECYEVVGSTADLYELQCGHCYHSDCWNGECCG